MGMDEWKLEKRKRLCAGCAHGFMPGEGYCSGIYEEAAGFRRREYCLPCWERNRGTPFSFWRAVIPKGRRRAGRNVDAIVEFFRRLIESPLEDPLRIKILYLTALILVQKRRLKLIRTSAREGGNVLIVDKTWDGEMLEIMEPRIGESEMESLKGEMDRLFDSGEISTAVAGNASFA